MMESVDNPRSPLAADPSWGRYELWGRRWSQAIAVGIGLNLILVLFNLTYVPMRQIYLQHWPAVVQFYDPIKGIEPHPLTQQYLTAIEALRSHLNQADFTSAETASILGQLRQYSIPLVEENPFLASGQITTFAHLKRDLQQFTGAASAERAFQQLWQAEYLQQIGWPQVNRFLQTRLEPMLQQNYFRETLPTGQFVDEFWRLDLFFSLFLGAELAVRTLIISRYQQGISWGAALARRWYELPLVLPFWRWLRVIPAVVRWHRTQLFNVEPLVGQLTHEPAAYLADRIAKFAIVRFINQTQTVVQEGALLPDGASGTRYTQVGNPAKLDQMTDRLVQLIVLRVMPTVQPDLEQLLRHSLRRALLGGQLSESLSQLPGFDAGPGEALDGIADYLAQATCDVLATSYADQEGRLLLDQLSHNFRHTLVRELQTSTPSQELQALVSDLLEELKRNYLQRSEQEDPEATLQEIDALDYPS